MNKDTPGRWLHNKFKFWGAQVKQPPILAVSLSSFLETLSCSQKPTPALQARGRGSRTDPPREGLRMMRTLWLAQDMGECGDTVSSSLPMVDENTWLGTQSHVTHGISRACALGGLLPV